jgi:hypothetical protein
MKRRANPEAQHSRQYAIAEFIVICLAGLIASACLFALTALAERGRQPHSPSSHAASTRSRVMREAQRVTGATSNGVC